MKLRLAAAIVLVVLSVGFAVFCMFRLNRCAGELTAALEAAQDAAAGDSYAAWEAATREALRLWERDSEFLHILLPHANLNELEWALGSLPEYLRQDERGLYAEQCVRALQCVNTVKEMERPGWGNIF